MPLELVCVHATHDDAILLHSGVGSCLKLDPGFSAAALKRPWLPFA